MKAGLMEIADIFIINKSDRPGADLFERNLKLMLAPSFTKNAKEVPIIKTIATEKKGIHELHEAIKNNLPQNEERRLSMLTEKAWQLLIHKRMKGVDKMKLRQRIEAGINNNNFNLYSFIESYA
jgi:LAO/AO transport system kinase